ncbi:hypothetical protein AX774_g5672 [Zancudomyces culisetae]|uniref:SANTA domain-containing protein n=1 Tax=Zancudomyces culisetae TaxID=1213189 RepID=A0A1R1PDE6_ZANCU|nr:hypothetical protein AX774_g7594 [Zancudomyces culisetae]OMH80819.1 hypothetical protein AX774_g5729 [Zancudomyces culisetae]OMH80881.1 hypothetical protein AX774_g5672 [Zancudomyces culisetae]|eukprot:OMH78997.1 hypothetical protein AX774_g7594 [Zancudomyces culisetae]
MSMGVGVNIRGGERVWYDEGSAEQESDQSMEESHEEYVSSDGSLIKSYYKTKQREQEKMQEYLRTKRKYTGYEGSEKERDNIKRGGSSSGGTDSSGKAVYSGEERKGGSNGSQSDQERTPTKNPKNTIINSNGLMDRLLKEKEATVEPDDAIKRVKKWYLQPRGNPKTKEIGLPRIWIIVLGTVENKKGKQYSWHSSYIKDRKSPTEIFSHSGSGYVLEGEMDVIANLKQGFSLQFCEHFRNGFPENWNTLIQAEIDRIFEHLQSIKASRAQNILGKKAETELNPMENESPQNIVPHTVKKQKQQQQQHQYQQHQQHQQHQQQQHTPNLRTKRKARKKITYPRKYTSSSKTPMSVKSVRALESVTKRLGKSTLASSSSPSPSIQTVTRYGRTVKSPGDWWKSASTTTSSPSPARILPRGTSLP